MNKLVEGKGNLTSVEKLKNGARLKKVPEKHYQPSE
jgi:hypothetical protein